MTKRMLIDASHPEETRVVVVSDSLLEDFDFETSSKKQIKGNIYLAKVTRVEPSLQAAFVDYGGNRHGFLAFSEIHPDYYQVPQADRRLIEDQQRALEERARADANGSGEEAVTEAGGPGDGGPGGGDEAEAVAQDPEEEAAEVFDEQARRRSRLLRSYKIQEVIKRRQIMLVQVVKEERGNKGAALTTYLSLAGRYCVLMPNTARGGGISRKIASPADRSRLKSIARELEVPDGMGLIIRTAGQQRNKQEIRRDYEYLMRLWNDIRELTLKSIAPCTIHAEGALVQRAIRDLYGRDVDEVLVEGEEAYRTARKVMSMLMPSRARRVKQYKDDLPLFQAFQVEDKLDAMHSPTVQLKSGGSIVIHTTEALTAIDVNSGRATRERNIEETALKTNLEAADEIARQLRLRDLAGLVVVDFIDMYESRNQRAIERRVRDALKFDRARVQLGRISAFGLLELSRQRLRPSFQELSSQPCPTCAGSGVVRSTGSAALQALRGIELEGINGGSAAIAITLPLEPALYVLNQKRHRLVGLEARYGMGVDIRVGSAMIPGQFEIERLERKVDGEAVEPVEAAASVPEADGAAAAAATEVEDGDSTGKKRRRRRRRRRRPGDGEVLSPGEDRADAAEEAEAAAEGEAATVGPAVPVADERAQAARSTMVRTGTGSSGAERGSRYEAGQVESEAIAGARSESGLGPDTPVLEPAEPRAEAGDEPPPPARRRRTRGAGRSRKSAGVAEGSAAADAVAGAAEPVAAAGEATAGERNGGAPSPVGPATDDGPLAPRRRQARRRRPPAGQALEQEGEAAAGPPTGPADEAMAGTAATPLAAAAPGNGAPNGSDGDEAGDDRAAAPPAVPEGVSGAGEGEEADEPGRASGGPPRRGWWSRFVRNAG